MIENDIENAMVEPWADDEPLPQPVEFDPEGEEQRQRDTDDLFDTLREIGRLVGGLSQRPWANRQAE